MNEVEIPQTTGGETNAAEPSVDSRKFPIRVVEL